MDYREEYEKWCTDALFDEATRTELKNITDEAEIKDRFYKQLSFGTGGLRGVLGAGTNRMNLYTVGKATQGLANFIRSQTEHGSVAIAYDSRIMSKEFALRAALILAANGIKAYLFRELKPTPMLSFAVRYLHATAGIVITASHNPPQYNGYKVYWSDGGQIVAPYDKQIIDEVNQIADYSLIKTVKEEDALASGLLIYLSDEVENAYIRELKKLILSPKEIKAQGDKLKIVYTPLNGTGNVPVRRVLKELGFSNVYVVPEQEQPDGRFPTLEYPNPEDKKAFALALALAKKVNAELVLATDPDADRLGIYVLHEGEYVPFTGNMSGLLIAEYELSRREALHRLPKNRKDGALVTTVVSSKMAYPMAKAYGLSVIEVLTGFKYIGEQMKKFEDALSANGGELDHGKGAFEYEFGYEESYGCLVGTHARDKDAVVAVMALCEAAAYYRAQGISLYDQMQNLYKKYGYYVEDLKSVTMSGAEGSEKIAMLLQRYRENPPESVNGCRVVAVRDYLTGKRVELASGSAFPIHLPKSNVLYFELENDCWCCVRPSGTEPKIKYYFGAKGTGEGEAKEILQRIKEGFLRSAEN